MEQFLKIGIIVKPQGIKGEVKVNPLTDDINRFKKLKSAYIDGKNYKILSAKVGGGVVFLALEGVVDRDQAESFRNKYILVDRENAVPLKKGTYFIADLIGASIILDNGEKLGEIFDITSANTDIIAVNTIDNRVLRFPFLKDAVLSVDIEKGEMKVLKKRLEEISVYED